MCFYIILQGPHSVLFTLLFHLTPLAASTQYSFSSVNFSFLDHPSKLDLLHEEEMS